LIASDLLKIGENKASPNQINIKIIGQNGEIQYLSIPYQDSMTIMDAVCQISPQADFTPSAAGQLLSNLPGYGKANEIWHWYILAGSKPADKLGGQDFLTSSCDQRILTSGENIALSFQPEAMTTIGKGKISHCNGNIIKTAGTITAVFTDCLYLEDNNRTAGIKLIKPLQTIFAEGQKLSISGIMGEKDLTRQIDNLIYALHTGIALNPLLMQNNSIAGADSSGQKGARSSGVNNVGLLIKTYGGVVAANQYYLWISDGSSPKPLKIYTNQSVKTGSLITATGIVSIETDGDHLIPTLLTRYPGDIQIINP
jgi:hypothetical protein